jgi:uncharacterized protein YjbI with pentapeptide repeats/O-antigen/teichoic acid export membrane protein
MKTTEVVRLKAELVSKLASSLNGGAAEAVDQLRQVGGLSDGTLCNARLTGINLAGVALSQANLKGAHLEWANLRDSDLQEAILQDAHLEVASLQRANLTRADLRGAVLVKARLQGAYLPSANLRSADLGEANLQGAMLKEADLSETHLGLADLRGVNLEKARLESAYLLGAQLQEAILSGATLHDAYFGEAILQRAILTNAGLQRATLTGANLRQAVLAGADAQEARLALADLRGADLSRSNFRGADLLKAQLQGATLTGADFQDAHLGEAQLQEARLMDADLQRAALTGAILTGADLTGAILQAAYLDAADLSGANLTGADLQWARLDNAQFDETTVLPDGTLWTPEVDLYRFIRPGPSEEQNSSAPVATPDALELTLVPSVGTKTSKNGDQPFSSTAVAVQPIEFAEPVRAIKKPSVEKATRRQIRGSSLLLVGRLISIAVTTFVQILTVRYLTKGDYGAFAYALSIEALGETIVTLGLDRAVTRFVPIYQEKEDYDKLFGTLLMVVGTIFALGTLLILVTLGLQGYIARHLIGDRLAVNLLVILIALSPINAFDNILNSMFAVFSSPSAIFFRKYVLAPALKIGVVMLLILGHSDVTFLAFGYVGSGLLGIAVFVVFLVHMMREQDLFSKFNRETLRIPVREVLSFTMPLLASDLVYVVMNSMDAVLLEHSRGSVDVAAFRAVQPTARLNQVVLASFALLFTPAAARLFAHDDKEGINRLYWQNAAWVAIASFPIFALTFSLAKPVTILLYGTRYEQSALIMAMLSFGYYFNAATGQNGLTLKVLGKLRYIVTVDIMAAVVNLGVNLVLIPRYGALGAATGTMSTMIIFNILKQAGLVLGTGIKIFDRDYLRVYAIIILGALGLLLVQVLVSPPVFAGFAVAALASVLVLKFNGRELDLASTFPELLRIPAVRWLFSE